ncbi:MAG: winged helix-turn-helix transcriptional regulator [Thaumarchaeota archaeon]|nr:winged helix-turn-helix transcriptional regulator [Nitrososphaerota archaeon]
MHPALSTHGSLWGLRQFGAQGSVATSSPIDPAFKRVMTYIFVGTRGGYNRVRIVELIKDAPLNPNQISEKLGLDYKTVQHHIKLLEENGVLVPSAKGAYGAMYFLTPYAEKHFEAMKTMWARFGQS